LFFKVLYMSNAEKDLQEIKSLMERSSRFISLSGLSGVFAGLYALAGAYITQTYWIPQRGSDHLEEYAAKNYNLEMLILALSILTLSILTAIFFTTRNARKKKQKVWDRLSQRMLFNLSVPLITGGIFILILLWKQMGIYLIAPAMLIFYGLALINGSKYTLNDIRYLGYCEIALGLLATYFYGNGLLFWTLGFGVLHIIYGALMYWKYER